MTAPLITVADVGKRFMLRQNRARSLRELARHLLPRIPKGQGEAISVPPSDSTFWALEHISFTVDPGSALGIVGHNGSGKSTLLKLLTGIMQPTVGRVQIRGRIGALIEVGAGFHPDLTGRENIYLNGSILGLTRREIDRQFDSIVAFAGLEKFVDTPVKRYSSGMYMRLGFSIATHCEPDVLLVDEVLAVGDMMFQRKCMHRMQEFIREGGAVVLVSHAMGQVAELCPRCLWIDRGHLLFDGPTQQATEQYTALVAEREEEEFRRNHPEEWAARVRLEEEAKSAAQSEREAKQENPHRGRIVGMTLNDSRNCPQTNLPVGKPCRFAIQYRLGYKLPNPVFTLEILREEDDMLMFATNTQQNELNLQNLIGEGEIYLHVSFMSLNEGRYRVRVHVFPDYDGEDYYKHIPFEDRVEDALRFTVSASRSTPGCVYLPVRWDKEPTVTISDDGFNGQKTAPTSTTSGGEIES